MFCVIAIPLRKFVNFLLKAKELILTLLNARFIFFGIILFTLVSVKGFSQERPPRFEPTKVDTLEPVTTQPQDSIATVSADSVLNKSDTIKAPPPPKGDIETTIDYSARDSIRASVDGKMIWLYGNAKIVYGSIELEAEEIVIDYGKNTLTANGIRDSLGQRIGYPIFKNGSELYETKDIVYNFKTGRARISEVVTQQGEGYLHSDAAFKN
jgi:hypothetical protein